MTATRRTEIHVAFCCDLMMLPGLYVAIGSLLAHASQPVQLWISLHNVGNRARARLTRFLAGQPKLAKVNFVDVDLRPYDRFRGLHGNRTIYARLDLPGHISTERLLYLDSDVVCLADVAPLFDEDLGSSVCGMVSSGQLGGFLGAGLRQRLGLPANLPCFNSGVILMNVPAWNGTEVVRRIHSLESQWPGAIHTGDQGYLNAVLHSEIAPLAGCWNVALCPSTSPSARSTASIAHFVGQPKPWDPVGFFIHRHASLFLRTLRMVGGMDVLLRHWLMIETWRVSYKHREAHWQRLQQWMRGEEAQ
jgi:lipopolysaccharide biosynthesis glycosyltransferase